MSVTVHYLFSNNTKIGSRIISWGTGHLASEVKDVPSHVAVLVNEKWVFESTLETGVHRISYEDWKKANTEVGKYKCFNSMTLRQVIDYFRKIHNKKYDYRGLLYVSVYIAMNKLFGVKIPKKNKWNNKDMYFCCEVVGGMLSVDYEMTTPVQIMAKMMKDSE